MYDLAHGYLDCETAPRSAAVDHGWARVSPSHHAPEFSKPKPHKRQYRRSGWSGHALGVLGLEPLLGALRLPRAIAATSTDSGPLAGLT